MLPTKAIQADAPAPLASGKERDATLSALTPNFSAYFSQMVANQPGSIQTSVPEQAPSPSPSRNSRTTENRKSSSSGGTGAATGLSASVVNAGAQDVTAQAGAQAGAGAQAAPATRNDPGTPGDSAGAAQGGSAPQPGAAAGTQAPGPLATASAAALAGPSEPGTSPSAKAGPSQAPATPAPVPASADSPQSAGTPGDALAQAYPGAKLQTQYGDEAPASAKAPLTELVNQVPLVTRASPTGAAGEAEPVAPAQAPAGTGTPPLAEATAALQALLASPLAGQAAVQAAAQASSLAQPALGSGSLGAIGATAGGIAAAASVGAGAQPGASGAVRVTASAAGAAARPARDPSLASQVDGTIRWLVKNQDQGAELQLHPESLGTVQIKLKVDGSVVHARIWASDAAAVPVLQEHRSFLESSLKSQGLTLGSFDLQQGHREQQQPLPAPSEPAASMPIGLTTGQAGQETPAALGPMAVQTSRIEYVA